MKQPDLFSETPPRTRTTDPVTSHKAERGLRASGVLNSQQAELLALVRAQPGSTVWELADGDASRERKYSRRISDLHTRGLVEPGPARSSRYTNREARTWRVAQ